MTICIEEKDFYGCIALLHKKILSKKAEFHILEHVTHEILPKIPEPCQIPFCDKITTLNEIGSAVVTGTALQMRLEQHFEESIEKSIEYIKRGNTSYYCDQISERVLGFVLLNYAEVMLPVLPAFLKENSKWITRMVGIGSHFAIEKGLNEIYVEELFCLLLNNANKTDSDEKSGIGLAAETTAKLHPYIIEKYDNHLNNAPNIEKWFKTSVETGLALSKNFQ